MMSRTKHIIVANGSLIGPFDAEVTMLWTPADAIRILL